jgi:hypothetical protein
LVDMRLPFRNVHVAEQQDLIAGSRLSGVGPCVWTVVPPVRRLQPPTLSNCLLRS